MIDHQIEIPEPYSKIFHDSIDSIALQFNQAFRSQSNNKNGFPFDADRFMDWLEISTEWDHIDEPEGATVFAKIDCDTNEIVQINEYHKDFFEQRPDVYRHCIGHESGHVILKHLEHPSLINDYPLFGINETDEPISLHKSSWNQFGLSSDEVRKRQHEVNAKKEKWVKEALINSKAREALHILNDKFEPEWMFWQAEQFARCLSVPRDRLFEILEEEPLFSGWRSVSRLASIFGVSTGTMKTRLTKLKLIELDNNGIPTPTILPASKSLFT